MCDNSVKLCPTVCGRRISTEICICAKLVVTTTAKFSVSMVVQLLVGTDNARGAVRRLLGIWLYKNARYRCGRIGSNGQRFQVLRIQVSRFQISQHGQLPIRCDLSNSSLRSQASRITESPTTPPRAIGGCYWRSIHQVHSDNFSARYRTPCKPQSLSHGLVVARTLSKADN